METDGSQELAENGPVENELNARPVQHETEARTLPERLRERPSKVTAAYVVTLALGLWFICSHWKSASPVGLVRYQFNLDDTTVQGLAESIAADWWVVAGLGLIVVASGVYVRLFAFSSVSRTLAALAIGTALVSATADVVENVALLPSLDLRLVAAVAATIKWCAILGTMSAVPAALVILIRVVCRKLPWPHGHVRDTDNLYLTPPKANQEEQQGAWRGSYFVPDLSEGKEPPDVPDTAGSTALCLSGGGVRSASIAMGAMQQFGAQPAEHPMQLDNFDHIISVSGGGYAAGALLLANRNTENLGLSDRFEEGSPEFEHVRKHASYIADSVSGLVVATAVIVRNLILSMICALAPAVLFGVVVGVLLANIPLAAVNIPGTGAEPPPWVNAQQMKNVGFAIAVVVAIGVLALLCATLVEVCSMRFTRLQDAAMRVVQMAAILVTLIVLVALAFPALMRVSWDIVRSDEPGSADLVTATGGVTLAFAVQFFAVLVAMLWRRRTALIARVSALFSRKASSGGVVKAVPRGVLPVITTTVALAALTAVWILVLGVVAAAIHHVGAVNIIQLHGEGVLTVLGAIKLPVWVTLAVSLAAIVVVGLLDVTSASLHPFYRRRLAEAFAVRRDSQGRAKVYPYSEVTELHTYGVDGARKPQFVFCAAATVTGKGKPAPGLNVYPYTLTADYIGGPDVGYLKTASVWSQAPSRLKRDLTVEAAMAVSGAAFASAMGRHGAWYQKLLAVSGARLGTWLPNPKFVALTMDHEKDASVPSRLPAMRCLPYFYREVLGINEDRARLLQVTDGGHYENLGLVEALRRKCRLVVCIDASGDPPPSLSTLHEAIRLAQSELGVRIVLSQCCLADVVPGSAGATGVDGMELGLEGRVAKTPIIIGDIFYPEAAGLGGGEASCGTLVVAKAVLTDACPGWLKRYAATDVVFPHESTSDQWFTEDRFAAYTELGRVLACAAVSAHTKLHRPPSPPPMRRRHSGRTWTMRSHGSVLSPRI